MYLHHLPLKPKRAKLAKKEGGGKKKTAVRGGKRMEKRCSRKMRKFFHLDISSSSIVTHNPQVTPFLLFVKGFTSFVPSCLVYSCFFLVLGCVGGVGESTFTQRSLLPSIFCASLRSQCVCMTKKKFLKERMGREDAKEGRNA